MKKIQMVDLKTQYDQIKDTVNASIQEVLDTTSYINGPQVHKFQKDLEEYLGVKHVIPCANGTDALQIAMMGLGLQPGDEVITADFTFAATVEVIALLQLTPVLVDVDADTYNISIEAIKKAITPKTKAIVPVHLFGQAANMEEILAIAKEHNLYVIEDNAQAIGADYKYADGSKKKAGVIGNVASTSFFPSKNLGCYGDGGAIFTNNDELAHTLRGIVNHGMYVRYHHDVVGVNSRLDSIQAAVLNAKLPNLDSYNKARREAAAKYSAAFAGHTNIVTPVITGDDDSHVFHQYVMRVLNADRDALLQHLLDKGIPCAIYYPIPLHSQKAYADARYNEADFPVTNQLVKEVIALPMHTELDDEQIAYITGAVLEFFKVMEKEGRKKLTAGGIIGFIIAFAISFVAVSYLTKGDDDYTALVKTSEEMNKTFPTKVDNDTRLDSTNVQKEPLTLNYYYTIVTLEKQAITGDLKDIVEQLKVGTQKNLDEAPEMAEFRNKNIALKYCYYDKNGMHVVDYTIKPTKK